MITSVRIQTTQALYGFDLDHEADSLEVAERITGLLEDIDAAENPPVEEIVVDLRDQLVENVLEDEKKPTKK